MIKRGSLLAVLLMAAALLNSHPSYADENSVTISRSVVVEPGFVPHINTMLHLSDNGFLIAGSIPGMGQAWATRTDATGGVKWRYVLAAHDGQPYQAFYPEYWGAVMMPNGDGFLCGRMPVLPHGSPALLTHLDAAGKMIQERLVLTADKDYFGSGEFRCFSSNGGFFGIGRVSKIIKSIHIGSSVIGSESYYWIVRFDDQGNTLSETLVKSKLDSIDRIGVLRMAADGDLLLVGQRAIDKTELVQLSSSGEVTVPRAIAGLFLPVQPIGADNSVQLVSAITNPVTVVTLDSNLQEINRVTRDQEAGTVHVAYHLPDHSLVLFGDKASPHRSNYRARVMTLDASLAHARTNLLEPDDEDSCCDGYAVPTGVPGEFASVRSALRRLKPFPSMSDDIQRVGAVIDFIEIR